MAQTSPDRDLGGDAVRAEGDAGLQWHLALLVALGGLLEDRVVDGIVLNPQLSATPPWG